MPKSSSPKPEKSPSTPKKVKETPSTPEKHKKGKNVVIPVDETSRSSNSTSKIDKSYKCNDQSMYSTSLDYSLRNPYDPSLIHSEPQHSVIPVVEAKSQPYQPMPYVFRLPIRNNLENIKSHVAKCPPFHVQLDHAIAVVWSLYAKEEVEKPLGINQLQWAWGMLNNLRNYHGRHPVDIAHCLETLTDELLEQYADMVDDVTESRKSIELSHTISLPIANSTALDGKDGFCSFKSECGNPECKGPAKSSVVFINDNEFDESLNDTIPFSVNYTDMINRTHSENVVDQKENCACRAGMEPKDTNSVVSFLAGLRKDQMKKILAELDRLHSIENYISSNADKEFEPYMDEKDKEMHLLLAEKIEQAKKKGDEKNAQSA